MLSRQSVRYAQARHLHFLLFLLFLLLLLLLSCLFIYQHRLHCLHLQLEPLFHYLGFMADAVTLCIEDGPSQKKVENAKWLRSRYRCFTLVRPATPEQQQCNAHRVSVTRCASDIITLADLYSSLSPSLSCPLSLALSSSLWLSPARLLCWASEFRLWLSNPPHSSQGGRKTTRIDVRSCL